ncbi:MAG: hypothetical protein ILP08_08885 [Lachnospiraceae bacterium]|nr:hypothetical protein [Lachnospiraceae bacterium]
MENVKTFLTRIRKSDKSTPRHIQILVSIGIASGIKDSAADMMAVSFEQMNPTLAILESGGTGNNLPLA